MRFRNACLALLLGAASVATLAGGSQRQSVLPAEGSWRGEFTVDGEKIPFNFEYHGKDGESARLTLINGSRRDYFAVLREGRDTFSAAMNTYDADLYFKVEDGGRRITGHYRDLVPSRRGARDLPFVAEHGVTWRFVEPGKDEKPAGDVTGKWSITLADRSAVPVARDTASAQEAQNRRGQIALLNQDGNRLTGVLMTAVGDTRELEGTVQGDRFYLSHFSGPSPLLITGNIDEDGNLQGAFGRGIYNVTRFEGQRDPDAELPDPYKLTYLKDGLRRIDFTFPGLDGKPISLSDDKYRGKVVIVEIIGTWCPNCTDQTFFLAPWFKENRDRGVEAIAVAFEQEDSFDYFQKTLTKFKNWFDIRYDIAFGGIADKKVATEKLEGVNYMAAFPTTFIIDRRGEVREIYTGYTGTVTGEYYEDYVRRFNALLDELIAEPDPYARPARTAEVQNAEALAVARVAY